MNERTTYFSKKITLLNVLSTFLVVILHAKPQERFGLPLDISQPFIYFTWVLSQAAVPLFFFLSAILFYRNCDLNKIPQKIQSRFWSLAVPYLLWNTFFVGVFWALTHISIFHSRMHMGVVLDNPKEIFYAILTSRYTVLWFVKDLIFLSVSSPIFILLLRNKILSMIFLIASVIAPTVLPQYVSMGYEHTMNWLPVYFMGAIVGNTFSYESIDGKINLSASPWNKTSIKWIVGVLSIIIFVATYLYAIKGEKHFYPYRLVAPICIWFLTDILLQRYITERFKVKQWMSYCFVVYCIHQFILNVVEKVFVLTTSPTSLILNFMYITCPAIVIGIAVTLCHYTHNTKVYKLLSGGR